MEACRLSSEASYKTGKAVPTGHTVSGRQPAVRQRAADRNVHPIPGTISPGCGGVVCAVAGHSSLWALCSPGGHLGLSPGAQGESAFPSRPTATFKHPSPLLLGLLSNPPPLPQCCYLPTP